MRILGQIVSDRNELNYQNSTVSFVLIVTMENNYYAITGGNGYFGIQNHIEEYFGVDLISKLINPDRIKYIKRKPLAGRIIQEESVYKEYYNYNFDSSNWLKLSKEILGEMNHQGIQKELGIDLGKKFKIKLQGKSSFTINKSLTLAELDTVLSKLHEVSQREQKFILYRGFSEVNGKSLKAKLTFQLVGKLNSLYQKYIQSEINFVESDVFLSYSDAREYLLCDSYLLSYRSFEPYETEELDLLTVFSYLVQNGVIEFTEEILSDIRITGLDFDGNDIFNSRLKGYIFAEIRDGKELYCFIDQKWYIINQQFIKRIDQQVSEIMSVSQNISLSLPKWQIVNGKVETEDEYINKICHGKLVKMHRDHIIISGRDKAEVCDVIDVRSDKVNFIFIKKGLGSSLRELFAQVRNSVELYMLDQHFKQKSLEKLFSKYEGTINDTLEHVTMAFVDERIGRDIPLINRLSTIIKLDLIHTIEFLQSLGINRSCFYEIEQIES